MTTAAYQAYLRSDAWQEKRRQAFAAKPVSRCYCCNRRHSDRRPLDLHHITYENLGHEFPDELILVCRICHSLIHQFAHEGAILADATDHVRDWRSINRRPLPAGALRRHPRNSSVGRQMWAAFKAKVREANAIQT